MLSLKASSKQQRERTASVAPLRFSIGAAASDVVALMKQVLDRFLQKCVVFAHMFSVCCFVLSYFIS